MQRGEKYDETLFILTMAVLLPISALGGKKKQKDSTDWLNAPTPDGSPTTQANQ